MIKKVLFIILLCFFSCLVIFADGYYVGKGMEGKRLAVHDPEFQGLSVVDRSVCSDLVYYVRTYLHDYAGFDIVDVQNLEEIKKLQAKSENAQYNAKTSLTAGLLEFAEYQAFIRISKSGSEYSISLSISDLTTSKVIAESIVNKLKKITDVSDVGVRKLILQIVPKLKVELTGMGKYTLSGNDTDDLTIEQELNFAKQEEKALQDTLSSVQVELKNISSDVLDMNSVARKAQLEVEKQISEQKLLMAQQKIKRLAEQKEKERIEKEKAINYTEELKKRIKDTSDEVERLAVELRSKKFEGLTFAEQITIIEKEKKAYIELRKKINDEIKNFYVEAEQEYNERKIDVNNSKNYRMGELTNGVPTETAKNLKIEENEKLYKELMQQAKNNEEKLRKENQLESILESIRLKQKDLAKLQVQSSLVDSNLLRISEYDGANKRWMLTVDFYNEGKLLISQNIFLSFNQLSKIVEGRTYTDDEMDGKGKKEKYLSYLDDVEYYDSLFRMGTPIIYVDVEFTVIALPDTSPSEYKITISRYVIKNTNGNRIIESVLSDNFCELKLNPKYDIRSEDVLKKAEEAKQLADKRAKVLEQKQNAIIQEQKRRKAEKERLAKYAKSLEKTGTYGAIILESIYDRLLAGVELGADVPFGDCFFVNCDIDVKVDTEDSDDLSCNFIGNLGLYKFLALGSYPCVFTSIGIGGGSFGFQLSGNVGLELPLGNFFKIYLGYRLKYYTEGYGVSNNFSIGASVPIYIWDN